MGYIVLIADVDNHCLILDYSLRKSRLVVRTIICLETYAFLDGFDGAFAVSADLNLVLGRSFELVMLTYWKQLFNALVKVKRGTEHQLTVKVAAARILSCIWNLLGWYGTQRG